MKRITVQATWIETTLNTGAYCVTCNTPNMVSLPVKGQPEAQVSWDLTVDCKNCGHTVIVCGSANLPAITDDMPVVQH